MSLRHLFLSLMFIHGCVAGEPEPSIPTTPEVTRFSWQPVDVNGATPRWGMYVAEGITSDGEDQAVVVGGVNDRDEVLDDQFEIIASDSSTTAENPLSMAGGRMCHCAMLDAARGRIIIIGGRDPQFVDNNTAVQVNLSTGEDVVVEAAGAADFPVGCQAFFFPDRDEGYVFGGLSSTRGTFSDQTFRFDGATTTFTPLEIDGPSGRYDASTHIMNDGTALLVGGMGLGNAGPVFHSDIWRFNPAASSWTLVDDSSVPPGRRYPWTAVAPDDSQVLFGFGSDSARGETVLGDLWSFDVATQAWSVLEVDGTPPSPRGFTYRWPGTDNQAGVVGFGYDGRDVVTDAVSLVVPTALRGHWH